MEMIVPVVVWAKMGDHSGTSGGKILGHKYNSVDSFKVGKDREGRPKKKEGGWLWYFVENQPS